MTDTTHTPESHPSFPDSLTEGTVIETSERATPLTIDAIKSPQLGPDCIITASNHHGRYRLKWHTDTISMWTGAELIDDDVEVTIND